MTVSGIELEPITHQSVQPIKALSHVGGSNRQIDPGRRSDSKHGSPYTLSKTAMSACKVDEGLPEPTHQNCIRVSARRCSSTFTRTTSVPGLASTRLRREVHRDGDPGEKHYRSASGFCFCNPI